MNRICQTRRICVFLVLALLGSASAARSENVPVGLELVLAVDTSASVSPAEYQLQMSGISQAFRDPAVIAAIEAHGEAGIAVAMVHWSAEPVQVLEWTRLADRASATRISARIEKIPRSAIGVTTAIGSAIALSLELLSTNSFDGRRQSVDVSGDGKNNSGLPLRVQRDRADLAGITVNGLAILNYDPTLLDYYRNHVITGPNAFVLTAIDFEDFARSFREKLLREIWSPVANYSPAVGGRIAAISR